MSLSRTDLAAIDVDIWPVLPGPPSSGGFVYFIMCDSPDRQIKIGYARNLTSRLSSAQTDCPYRLQLIAFIWSGDTKALEANIHERFRTARIRGEWFTASPDLVDFIVSVRVEMQRCRDATFCPAESA